MIVSSLAFLLIVSLTSGQQNDCAGGLKEGAVMDKGVYWYQCHNGAFEPMGCLSSNGRRLQVGESFQEKDIEITCTRTNDDFLMYQQTACIHNGKRIAPDAIYESADTWYLCERVGELYLYWKASGCMYENRRMYFYERASSNTTVFECSRGANPSGVGYMRAVGCVFKRNQEHMFGERYQDDEFLYSCESDGQNKAIQRVVGCVNDGEAYYDYQIYYKGNEIYRCEVSAGRTNATHKICGCVQRLSNRPPIEKLIGCMWVAGESNKPDSYLMACKLNDKGQAITQRIRCMYSYGGKYQVEVDPGCFRPIWGTKDAVGCQRVDADNVQVKVFPGDRLDIAYSSGLRFC